MKKCYAVTNGEYSDYRVNAIFVTREDAEKAAALMNESRKYDEYEVEEFALYETGEAPQKVKWARASVVLCDDGTVKQERQWEGEQWDCDAFDALPPVRPTFQYQRAVPNNAGILEIYGASAEAVAKVLSERKAAFLSRSWDPRRNLDSD